MKSIKYILATLVALAAVSCTETIVNDQIYLSLSSYTFSPEADSINIEINSNCDWSIDKTPEWISVERISETEAKIKAFENGTGSYREETITFMAGEASKDILISQTPKTYSGKFISVSGIVQPVFSIGNKFCAGYINEKNEQGREVTSPVVMNCLTGEKVTYEGTRDYLEVRAVSNDGRIVAIHCKYGVATVIVDGEPRQMTMPSEYFGSEVESISADGRIMVGYTYHMSSKKYVPVKWTDFEPEFLESPKTDLTGKPSTYGCMARGCSADGSVIYGSEWNTQGIVYWKDGKMFFPSNDYSFEKDVVIDYQGELIKGKIVCAARKYAEQTAISSNGRYIGATFNDYIYNGDDVPSTPYNYPAIIDTETNEMHFIKNEAFTDLGGISANNDGLCFAATPSGGVEKGYVADFNTGAVTPITDYMKSTYGIEVSMDRIITRSSGDGNTVSGYWVVPSLLGTQYKLWCYIADPDKVE